MPNNKKDTTVNIDTAQRKNVGIVICQEINKALQENSSYYKRAQRNQNLYNQVSKWTAANKVPTEPWYGAADYFVPLVEWIVDAVWGRVLKTLFYKRPYMQARGEEASDVEKEEGVTDFTDQILNEQVKVYENMRFFVKQKLIMPFAVLKYCWAYEYDRSYEKAIAMNYVHPETQEPKQVLANSQEENMQLVASGFVPTGQEEVIVEKPVEIYNGAKLTYIRFEDYVWHAAAKRGAKPYFEGDRFWLTLSEMTNNPEFDKDTVTRLRVQNVTSGTDIAQAAINQRAKLFECFHWYGRLPLNKTLTVDFQDPEAIEHEVHCIVSFKEQELLFIEKWAYGRTPAKDRVYIRGEFEETENFGGRSMVDKLYQTQKELNTFHNSIMNNAMLCMQKIFFKRRTLQDAFWQRPQLRPGLILEIDMPGDVGVLEVGDVKQIAWELETSLINFAERISNISIYQTGTARQGGSKTKGEVDRTVYEGNIGMDKFVESCFLDMKKVSQWTLDYYYNNMPQGLERRIRGENGQPIFPTQENAKLFEQKGILPQWVEDDIAGKFDFKWESTSLNSSESYNIQVANDLMAQYLPQPMVAQSLLATWDILRRGLVARKITDWQNILPPKEAILAEMKRMELEAKAQEQGASAGNMEMDVKKKAAEMAIKKGVPPEIANQLLNQAQPGGKNVQA